MKKFFIIFCVLVLLGFLFDPGLTLTILAWGFGIPIGLILLVICGVIVIIFVIVVIVISFLICFKISKIWENNKKQQIEYQIIFSGDYLIGKDSFTTHVCTWTVECSKIEAERNVSKWRTQLPEESEVSKTIYEDIQRYKTDNPIVKSNIVKSPVIKISK